MEERKISAKHSYDLYYFECQVEDLIMPEDKVAGIIQAIPRHTNDTKVSFHLVNEDKRDIVHKIISANRNISMLVTDSYCLCKALANITLMKITFNDIDPHK
jgi:hypothetical protein